MAVNAFRSNSWGSCQHLPALKKKQKKKKANKQTNNNNNKKKRGPILSVTSDNRRQSAFWSWLDFIPFSSQRRSTLLASWSWCTRNKNLWAHVVWWLKSNMEVRNLVPRALPSSSVTSGKKRGKATGTRLVLDSIQSAPLVLCARDERVWGRKCLITSFSFVQVMKNLKSHGIFVWVMGSHEKWCWLYKINNLVCSFFLRNQTTEIKIIFLDNF